MLKYMLFLMVMVFTLTSCAGTAKFQRVSSGKIGCSPSEIQIKNLQNHFFLAALVGGPLEDNWIAECKGVKYYCSSATTRYGSDASCAEEK